MEPLSLAASAGAALLPVLSDGIRGVFARLTGSEGANPQTVEERIELARSDTERLRALAELDSFGDSYKWVNAIRALQRPLAVFVILTSYAFAAAFIEEGAPPDLAQFAQLAVFYLFGERTNYHARKRKS